jgi:hypothetical protein
MRNRNRRALYGLAATVAVTTTLGLSAAGMATASVQSAKPDITPACTYASYCSDPLFNVQFGIQYFQSNESGSMTPGAPISLSWANSNNPGEDWRVTLQSTVHDLYHLGWVSSAIELHYRTHFAFEVMWTPYGVETNLCRGLARNAREGEEVTLQPCGDFPRTLWIVGENYTPAEHAAHAAKADIGPFYAGNELITAASVNPSVPYILTAGGSTFGGDPFAPLQVDEQTADDGVLNPSQAWCTASVKYPYTSPPPTFLASASPSPTSTLVTTTPPSSASVTPPTIGPPTYTANSPCFPLISIFFAHVKA